MTDKIESEDTEKLSKSEIVEAHEKVKDLPKELGEEMPGAYGTIYEAVNRGEFV